MDKVTVEYSHDPANLQTVYLARVPAGRAPTASEWVPALRDTVRGKRVVWARFADSDVIPLTPDVYWLKDRDSSGPVHPLV